MHKNNSKSIVILIRDKSKSILKDKPSHLKYLINEKTRNDNPQEKNVNRTITISFLLTIYVFNI